MTNSEGEIRLVYALTRISELLGSEQAVTWSERDRNLIEAYEASQRELRDELVRRLLNAKKCE